MKASCRGKTVSRVGHTKITGLRAGYMTSEADPGERYDLKEYFPEIVQRLEGLAAAAREDLGDDLTGVAGNNRREPGRIAD